MSPDDYNRRVLAELVAIRKDLAEIKARMASGGGARQHGSGGGNVASDSDLDSPYGNPVIKKDPARWDGPSFAGYQMSECSPEYLECFAEFKDWQANKDDETGAKDGKGRPKSFYSRKDAARARGWARRLRNGWQGAPAEQGGGAPPSDDGGGYGGGGGFTDDDVPFVTCEPNEWGL